MKNDKPKRRYNTENLKPFQPGQSGNPKGRGNVPDDIKEARKFTAETVEMSIHKMLKMTKGDLRAMLSDVNTNALDILLGSVLAKGMAGDHMRANFILDRAGAQLPEPTPQINLNLQIQNMSNKELVPLAQEAIRVIQQASNPLSMPEKSDGK